MTLELSSPNGVKWVRLRYRNVNQTQDYQLLEMDYLKENLYSATVPAEHINTQWDFMYFFEVMDMGGNGRIYPDLNKQTPYYIVKLER